MVSETVVNSERLALLVERELRRNRATAGLTIAVAVKDGTVVLGGTVDELQEVPAAIRVAAGVPGVASVIERLHVEHLL